MIRDGSRPIAAADRLPQRGRSAVGIELEADRLAPAPLRSPLATDRGEIRWTRAYEPWPRPGPGSCPAHRGRFPGLPPWAEGAREHWRSWRVRLASIRAVAQRRGVNSVRMRADLGSAHVGGASRSQSVAHRVRGDLARPRDKKRKPHSVGGGADRFGSDLAQGMRDVGAPAVERDRTRARRRAPSHRPMASRSRTPACPRDDRRARRTAAGR